MDMKYKLLVVDDSAEWLKSHLNMIKQLFSADMFEIDTAASGKTAFSKVLENRDNPYNIVITDLEMELVFDDYAGSWLIKNLINREECKSTKFLIISGAYSIKSIAESYNVEFIPKDMLLNNPMLLKFKILEMLKIEEA